MKLTAVFTLTMFLIHFLVACNNSDNSKKAVGESKTKIRVSEVKEYKDSVDFAKIQRTIDEREKLEHRVGIVTASDFPTNQDLVGYGLNSSTLQPTGKIVMNNNDLYDTSKFTSSGQEVTKILERVTSRSSLYEKLGIDVKASFSYGAYKGSAYLQMLNESSINSYSDYLFLKVTVINSPLLLKRSKLTKMAKELSNNKNLFKERYGNEFFYGKITGGEFACLFEFISSSSSSKKSVKAGIDLAVKTMFASGNLSLAMEQLTSKIDEKTSTKIKFYRLGDEGKLAADSVAALIEYANLFPEKVKNNGGKPVVIRLLSKPILYIDDLPNNFKANDFLIFNKQVYYLDSLATVLMKIQDFNGNYNYAIDNSNKDYFTPGAIDSANIYLEQNKLSIEKIKLNYKNCLVSIQDCSTSNSNKVSYSSYVPKSSFDDTPQEPDFILSISDKVIPNSNDYVEICRIPNGKQGKIEFKGKLLAPYDCFDPFVSNNNNDRAQGWEMGGITYKKAYPVIEIQIINQDGTKTESLRNSNRVLLIKSDNGETIIKAGLKVFIVGSNQTLPFGTYITECDPANKPRADIYLK